MTSTHSGNLYRKVRQTIALVMVGLLGASSAIAGITITTSNGITATGADGVQYVGPSGITATGADGFLAFAPNGITATGADGITATGADGYTYTGANGITATGADGLSIASADGITATGADGITATGADGTPYQVDSVTISSPSGITATGADGITATGADGITATGADSRAIARADGVTVNSPAAVNISGANGITATGADGQIISISSTSLSLTGVNLLVVSGSQNVTWSGARGIVETGLAALTSSLIGNTIQSGLKSVDPELALQLNRLTDDSTVNAVIVYYQMPTDADLGNLQQLGVVGGTRYRALPLVTLTATRAQIMAISQLPAVRSIYGNRTLQSTLEPEVRAETGVDRAWNDREIATHNLNTSVSGRGVTVAVLDTGLDGTHGDLAGRVVQNVKLADTQSASAGFNYPVNLENLSNTDQAYGHGTFVAGVIAGNGSLSGGKYSGVAPGARVVGLSAGDLTLLYVLDGFDYLLSHADLGARVVNCSFSANTVFDPNDPVNVATKMMADRGINVVFSAGNSGPGLHSLNPYAVAPWVVSVGATDTQGRLASFSSRGDFASALFHPTLVAPGVSVVSLRGSGVTNVTGAEGATGADTQRLSASELPYYTTASGTSFSAPQVAGAIALMLEANPNLTPAQTKDILQRTATPLPPYYQHEVGVGMLNVHAAVLQATFPVRRIGEWRATLDRGQVRFINDPLTQFSGSAQPGTNSDVSLQIPDNALLASVQISWGPLWSTNDLGLELYGPDNTLRAQSNAINLPGLTGNRERVVVSMPTSGSWRASVKNTIGVAVTAQPYFGVLEVGRAQYAPLPDVVSLSPTQQSEIYQSLRSYVMWSMGKGFCPGFAVSRADLAAALVLGARVPQYLPGQPSYRDVRDAVTMTFVESAQASPNGSLFVDATPGGNFRPNDPVIRLTAVVALVRAAGFRAEAEAKAGSPLAFLDALSIPTELRGYVAVALARGLISSDSSFRPQASMTRAELAHAMVAIERLATQ
jgi:serine protease AprX